MIQPIVIKYGGSLLEEPTHRDAFLKQAAQLLQKEKVVLVHGGGKEITKAVEAAGLEARFVNGRRFTDSKTMAIVDQVLARINQEMVTFLNGCGAKVQTASGKRGLLVAEPIQDLGQVGSPKFVNSIDLQGLLSKDMSPVFYSVAEDTSGHLLNINADDFALALAISCQAKRLIFLTETGAILDAHQQPIARLTADETHRLIKEGVISGGMKVKAEACLDAIAKGVGRVDICKGIDFLIDPSKKLEGTSFIHS